MGLLDILTGGGQQIDPTQLQMLQLLGITDPAQIQAMQQRSQQQAWRNSALNLAAQPGEMSYFKPNRGASIAKSLVMLLGGAAQGQQQGMQQQIGQLAQLQQVKELFGKQQREAAMRDEYQKIIGNPESFKDLKPGQRAALDIASKTGNVELLTKIITDAYNPEKQQQPTEWSTIMNAAGGDPNKALAMFKDLELQKARASKTDVNLNAPAVKPFAEKSYEQMAGWEKDARVAQQTLSGVQNVRALLSQMEGGQYENVLSYLQAADPTGLLPKDKAQLRQKFTGAVAPMIQDSLQMMRGLGAMSDREFAAATSRVPQFGQQKEATEYLVNLIESKSKPLVENYTNALAYSNSPEFEKSGFLKYRPSYTQAPYNPTAATPASPQQQGGVGGLLKSLMGNNASKPSEPAPYPEGTQLQGPGGKLYVVRNGQPVPL